MSTSYTRSKLSSEDDLRAGEYVLGLMTDSERQAFERQYANNTSLQQAVNDWQARFAHLSDQLTPIAAPQSLSARIHRSLDVLEAEPVQQPSSTTTWWNNLTLWRNLALASFLGLAIFTTHFTTQTPTVAETTYVAVLVAPQNKQPGWVIKASEVQQNSLEVIPLGVVDIPEGKALQFWTKANGWDKPVSLGLVQKGQKMTFNINDIPLTKDQLFEFTVENKTGSPTGLPTGPVQSIGRGTYTF